MTSTSRRRPWRLYVKIMLALALPSFALLVMWNAHHVKAQHAAQSQPGGPDIQAAAAQMHAADAGKLATSFYVADLNLVAPRCSENPEEVAQRLDEAAAQSGKYAFRLLDDFEVYSRGKDANGPVDCKNEITDMLSPAAP